MKTRVLLTALTAAGVAFLAGCGAGLDAQTARTQPSIAGVSADGEGVAVRNAVVGFAEAGYQAGGDAPVLFAVANTGRGPVVLSEVASESAAAAAVESATPLGATAPPSGAAATQVALEPGGFANVTVRLTGLSQPLNGTSAVPLTLTFDNGTVLRLTVPMASPEQALPREAPVVEEGGH